MTPLVLVAAGGLAREAIAVLGRGRDVVLLDDDAARWGAVIGGAPVVGPLEKITAHPDREVVVCAGNGAVRRNLVARLAAHGVEPERYAAVVHPAVRVPAGCTIGRGSIVLAGVILTADVRVGEHVVVMPSVTLTHDVVLEDFSTVCAGVSLGGGVRVEEAAYLGMNASARPGVVIGAGATLGMGSVLLHDVPPGETWAGVAAAPLRGRRLQEA